MAAMVVLASPIPSNREVLGEQAVYFDDISVDGIESKIAAIINSMVPEIGDIGLAARQRVRTSFSWPKVAKRYAALYSGVVHDGQGN